MESFDRLGFDIMPEFMKKKRTNALRRPRIDYQVWPDNLDNSLLASTSPSGSVSKSSSDNNSSHGSHSRKKELFLNQCSARASSSNTAEAETVPRTDIGYGIESIEDEIKSNRKQKNSQVQPKRPSEGVLAPTNWRSVGTMQECPELHLGSRNNQMNRKASGKTSLGRAGVTSESPGVDNNSKKVKLKVGGVTRTIRPISTSDGSSVSGSSFTKYSHSSDASPPLHKLPFQDSSDENHSSSPDKKRGLAGVQLNKPEPIRQSKRIPKRRLLSSGFSDEEDNEVQYVEKLKNLKGSVDFGAEFEDEDDVGRQRHRKISRVLKKCVDSRYNVDEGDNGSSRSSRKGKNSRSGGIYKDDDYLGEEEPVSDGEPETKRKRQKKEIMDVSGESTRKVVVTRHQRALKSGNNITSDSGVSLVEFPNGLPPAPPRRQKEKPSELEQQLKKAEAAQRRRDQVEKAARETEAEAIRKILGQDSSRKKREDKIKKRQEELAQEKAATAMALASSTVRWVMGPSGTVVTFPKEMGLPSVFDGKPCSYPPPREKCAGPSCSNPYRYRDSKLKLPLCSLQCYKAIQEKMPVTTAC